MELLLYFILFFALCQIYLWPQLGKRAFAQRQTDFQKQLYNFQLKTVRQYYPELQNLTYSEIDQQFKVRDAYFRIK